ncbi:hypothetical protein BCR44DRAFT_1482922 [Catenaria anguillulae PL171]|uniref:Vacuolar protein sorting-associated protein n=1 Tax=Catenaria anguillulae PL171 TaxID=765915 RepID=A0A1Y2HX34_9FUNG|nr:hypothetical protein BCR44DRAFT_1482922 [Catenaria anguillulae PL171]
MFEQVLATLLNRVLGDYVQGLETTQLSVGVWAGDVQLRSLRLRGDALIRLGLPIAIQEGSLGSLVLKIPWKNLKSQPIRILIDRVSFAASPRDLKSVDIKEELERAFRQKLSVLAGVEERRKAALAAVAATDTNQSDSYTAQLITKLIDNIQVSITNISVQFIDELSTPTRPYAVDLSLQELSIVSVNEQWQEQQHADAMGGGPTAAGQTRKLLKLSGLAVVWKESGQEADPEGEDLWADSKPDGKHSVLCPVNAEGRLTINRHFGPNLPQFDLNLSFADFSVSLRRHEYESIWLALHYFRTLASSLQFIHVRTSLAVQRNSHTLWRYALDAAMIKARGKVAPRTRQFLDARRKTRLEYISLAKARRVAGVPIVTAEGGPAVAMVPVPSTVATAAAVGAGTEAAGFTSEQAKRLEQLQRDLSLEDVLLFEDWALHVLRQEARQKYAAKGVKSSSTSVASTSGGSTTITPPVPTVKSQHTASEASTTAASTSGGGWGGWWPFSRATTSAATAAVPDPVTTAVEPADEMALAGAFPADPPESPSNTIEISDLQRLLDLDITDNAQQQQQQELSDPNCLLLRVKFNLKTGALGLEPTVAKPSSTDHKCSKDKVDKGIVWQFGDLASELVLSLNNTVSVFMSMGTFTMLDRLSESGDKLVMFPPPSRTGSELAPAMTLSSSSFSSYSSSSPLFSAHVKHAESETSVSVTTQSLVVVCSRALIDQVVSFFDLPDAVQEDFQQVALAVSQSTRAGLQFALEQRRAVNIKMDVAAPVFLVPLPDDKGVLGLDTGRLVFTSRLPDALQKSRLLDKAGTQLSDQEIAEMMDMLVDTYDVKLSNASLFLGNSVDQCLVKMRGGGGQATPPRREVMEFIVKDLDVLLTCKKSAFPPGIMSSVPALSLVTVLPSVDLCLSDRGYNALMLGINTLVPPDPNAPPPSTMPAPPLDDGKGANEQSAKMDSTTFGVGGTLDVQLKVDQLKVALAFAPPFKPTVGDDAATAWKDVAEAQLGGFVMHLHDTANGVRDVKVTLSTILVKDLQQRVPELQYLVSSAGTGIGSPSMRSAPLSVVSHDATPDITGPMSALVTIDFKQEPGESVIAISLDNIRAIVTKEALADIYHFTLVTFLAPPPQQPQGHLSPLAAPATPSQKPAVLSASAAAPPPSKTKLQFQLHGVTVSLNDAGQVFSRAHLGESSVAIDMYDGQMSISGTLGALRVTAVHSGETLARIDGATTAKFRYDSATKWALDSGFDALVWFSSEALVLRYLPAEINRTLAFLSAFTTTMVDVAKSRVAEIAETVTTTRFGWDVTIDSPVIVYARDGDELHAHLGSLSSKAISPGPAAASPPAEVAQELAFEASLQDVNLLTKLKGMHDEMVLHRTHLMVSMRGNHLAVDVSSISCNLTQEQWRFLALVPQDLATQSQAPVPATTSAVVRQDLQQQQPPSSTAAPASAVSQSPSAQQQPLDISFSCNSIHLQVRDLLRAELNHLFLQGIIGSTKTLAEGGCTRILLRDLRPGPIHFHDVITSVPVEPFGHTILVSASNDGPNDPWTVSLTADSLRAIMNPAFFLAVQDFFMLPTAPEPATMTQTKPIATASRSSTPAHPQQQQPQQPALRFQLKLINPEITLVHTLADPRSPALVLVALSIQVAISTSPFVQVKGLGAFLRRMDNASSQSRILQDLAISLVPQRNDDGLGSTVYSLSLGKLVLRLSYRHIVLLQSFWTMWSQGFLAPAAAAGDAGSGVHDDPLVPPVTGLGTGTGSRRQSAQTPQPPSMAKVIVRRETMHVSSEGIRFLLVDDLSTDVHGPVLDCSIQLPRSFEINDWASALQVSATIETNINFWNPQLSVWEPLIEQCKLQVIVQAGDTLSVAVQSKGVLEATVSQTLLAAVNRVSNLWPTSVDLPVTRQKSRLVFHNDTGFPIRVRPSVGATSSPRPTAGTSATLEIPDGAEGQFAEAGDYFDTTDGGLSQVRVEVLMPTQGATHPLPILRETKQIVALEPSLSTTIGRSLYLHVTTKQFTKVVHISSPYRLCNEQISIIKADHHFHVPMHNLTALALRVRPHGQYGYGWSSPITYEQAERRKDLFVVTKSSFGGPPFTLVSHVVVEHEEFPGIMPLTTVELYAPLTIENNLPESMRFQILSRHAGAPIVSESLDAESHVCLSVVDIRQPIGIRVQVPSLHIETSGPAIVPALEDIDGDEDETQMVPFGPSSLAFRTHYVIPGGLVRKVTVYLPFVLRNKLALPLDVQCYRTNGYLHINRDAIHGCSDEKIAIRVGGADQSSMLRIGAIAGASGVVLRSMDGSRYLHVGLTLDNGPLDSPVVSKLVTFWPRFVFVNACDIPLVWKQVNTATASPCDPHSQSPILWLHQALQQQLVCRPAQGRYDWSSPLQMNEVGETFLRVNPLSSSGDTSESSVQVQDMLLAVSVALNEATVFIRVAPATQWPFRIESLISDSITISQVGQRRRYQLPAGQSINYSWDDPTSQKLLALRFGSSEHVVNLFEIGSLPPFEASIGGRSRLLECAVVLEDNVRVLRVRTYQPDRSIYRAKQRSSISSSNASHISFELVSLPSVVTWSFTLDLDLGLSIVSEGNELAYVSLRNLNVVCSGGDLSRSLDLNLHWIQVDNQMPDANEEIAIYPADIIRGAKDRNLLQLSLSQSTTNDQFFKHFTVLLQELSVAIDMDFIMAFANFVKPLDNAPSGKPWAVRLRHEPPQLAGGHSRLLYFETFACHPMKINVTFTMGDSKTSDITHLPLGVLTASLGNVSNMPVPIEGLILDNLVVTPEGLVNSLSSHVYDQAIRKLYSVIGSVDLLGNPVQLWSNISSGVKSFFIEPYAMSLERPQDIGLGILKGGGALVGKTVYGFADGFARFSSSVGKGLAAATMDNSFQQSRARARRRNRPSHGLSGVAVGVRSLGSNLVSAATGIVQQPIQGASREGVSGFFKGVAKAGIGLVVKPVLGLADAANSISEGIRNTTTVLDDSYYELERMRLPRVLYDGVIQPFSERDALGQFWLHQIEGAKGRYVKHFETKLEDNVVIVTDKCIVLARLQSMHAEWICKLRNVNHLDSKLFAHSTGQRPIYFFRIVQYDGEARMVEATDAKALDGFRAWLQTNIPRLRGV